MKKLFEYNGLIELLEMDNSFCIDYKYATENNFTGIKQYEFPLVLIQKDIAPNLINANNQAKKDGNTIVIFDIYRPMRVQQAFYDTTPDHLKMFVAKPSKNSRHCKGMAVDISLCDKDGNQLPMPSQFDEFSERTPINYAGGTKEERYNRDYLIDLMSANSFNVYEGEWWHYNGLNPDNYEVQDITFSEFIELKRQWEN